MSGSSGKAQAGSFQSMNLGKDLLAGLNRMGYRVPTPVQRKALPVALAGMDIVCMSRTGSGKTCVFLLPVIEKLKSHDGSAGVRAVILSPTRELAMQTHKFSKDMAKFTDLRIAPIIGGDPLEPQFEMLASRPDLIVATPGRLMHLLQEISTFNLKSVQILVFDEADRLFEMGFAEQLNEIVRGCPQTRQTLLFSATMPKMLVQFTRAGLKDPQLIRLETDSKLSDELRLAFFAVRSNEKISALLYLVRRIIPSDQQTIIFTATRHHSEFIHHLLDRVGVKSTLVYGTMDQESRSNNLKLFRSGLVKYLVVTDLAARGIDVPLLNNVINYHFPPTPKLFVHRCGRAARQGRIGFAFSLVDPEELAYAMDVHLFLDKIMENPRVLSPDDSTVNGKESEKAVSAYDLSSMQPAMVHSGLLPQDVLDQETEYIRTALNDDTQLSTEWRISENAMKQYRRTRGEASKLAVKKSRELVKSEGILHIHPLIMGTDPRSCSSLVMEKVNYVKHLQTFRPNQTVFETGIGFGTGSQAVKGIGKKGSIESKGVEVMKALRKEFRSGLIRTKSAPGAFAAELAAKYLTDTEHEDASDGGDEDVEYDSDIGDENDEYGEDDSNDDLEDPVVSVGSKRPRVSDDPHEADQGDDSGKVRMSRAARKKCKKHGSPAVGNLLAGDVHDGKKQTSYQDEKYYMTYGTENETANYRESSLQPKAGLKSAEMMNASVLESAMLDIAPDDALEMNRKKRMMRWDAKKRKFVKQSLEEMAQTGKGAKRIRTESGVTMSRKSDRPVGEMYEKWKKKSRREVEIAGVPEADSRPRPNAKYNTKVPDELRKPHEIKSLKKKREGMKLKNMSKVKRKSVLGNAEKKKAAKGGGKVQMGTKAGQRKVKAILRR